MRLTAIIATCLALGAASTLPWHWRRGDELAECKAGLVVASDEMAVAATLLQRTGRDLRAHGAVVEAAARECGGRQ